MVQSLDPLGTIRKLELLTHVPVNSQVRLMDILVLNPKDLLGLVALVTTLQLDSTRITTGSIVCGTLVNQKLQFRLKRSTQDRIKSYNIYFRGVLFPHWDDALGLLYITGKGDSSIKYFEF